MTSKQHHRGYTSRPPHSHLASTSHSQSNHQRDPLPIPPFPAELRHRRHDQQRQLRLEVRSCEKMLVSHFTCYPDMCISSKSLHTVYQASFSGYKSLEIFNSLSIGPHNNSVVKSQLPNDICMDFLNYLLATTSCTLSINTGTELSTYY